MSLKNLEAAMMQLSAKATEHYAAVELIINNPVAISEHTDHVGEIIRRSKAMAECEEAYNALHKHFLLPQKEADSLTKQEND
tara:strand:- start:159 stop:404 length:246 start_codon:yes stop_codon:yes gene_type:complete